MYFKERKRGEIGELKSLLQETLTGKDVTLKREVLHRVINMMTMGVDVSDLFMDMIKNAATTDIVSKKMIYLYMSHYATSNQELSLLAVNTLQKDCRDDSPMVRGLALRTLSALRLANIVEYLIPLIRDALQDFSPYVRKAAVMAVVKVWSVNPTSIQENGLFDRVFGMIRDNDPQVVANVLYAMSEIRRAEGGIPLNRSLIIYLLNRLREFNEWHQCLVLDLVCKYTPESEDETFDIMNILEDILRTSNSSVLLQTVRSLLQLTAQMPDVHHDVYSRVRESLLTLASTATAETSFASLCHLKLLIARQPQLFSDGFKAFYVRETDSAAVRLLKLDLLVMVADKKNAFYILDELNSYVFHRILPFARKAIRTISRIAFRVPDSVETCKAIILKLMEFDVPYIRSESLCTIREILRKFPEQRDIIPLVAKYARKLNDEAAQESFIWMVGEFGEWYDRAPYVLEKFVERYRQSTHSVKKQLLTSTMKLFFKRAPECQHMLGRLFEMAMADVSDADVHDRALFYYRMLTTHVGETERCFLTRAQEPLTEFLEERPSELEDRLFEEFNSLSVVYGKPSDQFVDDTAGSASAHGGDSLSYSDDEDDEPTAASPSSYASMRPPTLGPSTATATTATTATLATSSASGAPIITSVSSVSAQGPPTYPYPRGFGPTNPSSVLTPAPPMVPVVAPTTTTTNTTPTSSSLGARPMGGYASAGVAATPVAHSDVSLSSDPVELKPDVFQQRWGTLPQAGQAERNGKAQSGDDVLDALDEEGIVCLASGMVGGEYLKGFFYAQEEVGRKAYHMLELIFNVKTGVWQAKVKSDQGALIPSGNILSLLEECLG